MAMDAHEIERLIKEGIPDAKVTIRDLAGDGDHYAAEVVAESFRGKSRVQQHQMVYEALKGNMGGVLLRWRCRPAHRNSSMSAIGDFVKGVVTDVLQDMLRKASSSRRAKAAQAHHQADRRRAIAASGKAGQAGEAADEPPQNRALPLEGKAPRLLSCCLPDREHRPCRILSADEILSAVVKRRDRAVEEQRVLASERRRETGARSCLG